MVQELFFKQAASTTYYEFLLWQLETLNDPANSPVGFPYEANSTLEIY